MKNEDDKRTWEDEEDRGWIDNKQEMRRTKKPRSKGRRAGRRTIIQRKSNFRKYAKTTMNK